MTPRTAHSERTAAVIGAGIAGAACARMLTDNGWAVTLFDAGRGPGGRSSTRRSEQWQFDHGAQYFTVRDARFGKQVADWITRGAAAPWDAELVSLRAGTHAPLADQPQRFVGVPGMSALASDLASHCTLRRNVQVTSLEPDVGGWMVRTGEGPGPGRFSTVAVATQPSQARLLLADMPDLAQRAIGAQMQPCWATLVGFQRRLPIPFDAAFVEDSPLRWIARDSSKPGRLAERDSWVLHASPAWSERSLDLSGTAAQGLMLEAFFSATGLRPEAPAHVVAHRWRSARPVASGPATSSFSSDLRVGVCGDWLADGRVEGAYLSGVHLAAQVLAAGPQQHGVNSTSDRLESRSSR